MATTQELAAALKYGPKTQQSVRRSEYLSSALKQMQQAGPITGGYGEVAAKLLATAILHKAGKSADSEALSALKGDQDTQTASLIAALRPPKPQAPPATPPVAGPQPMTVPPPEPVQQAPLPPAKPAPTAAPQITPEMDAIVRTVWGEARGERPEGQAAVAGVILNRAKERGLSATDVVRQPGQFEPWGNPQTRSQMEALTPDSPEYQAILQNIQPVFGGQNPVGGADHFYSPGAQSAMGRPPPKWDNGSGQDMGRHRFFDLEQPRQNEARMVSGPAPQEPVQIDQSFQVATNQMQPGMVPNAPPSAPGSSPLAGGTAPAGIPPQASPAGANPQWPTYQPSEQEVGYVEQLLNNPQTRDQGVQMAQKLREKMTQPVAAKIVSMNGLQFYVPETPNPGAPPVMIPVPQEARTQLQSAQQAGIAAPPGTTYDVDPYGNHKQVAQPQAGQQVVSGQGQPYREAPIQGGSNDPTAPAARFTNEGKLRDDYEAQIKPYTVAREGYQKVVQAAKTGNPAGDIALVFGYMKTLDPGSTVREGEQAQIANSGTIPQSITNVYNKLIAGSGSLSPEQRAQFADSARQQFSVYENTANALNSRFGQLAQSYGLDPNSVVRQFEAIQPFTPPDRSGNDAGWSAQLPPAQLQSAMRFKGATAPGGTEKNPRLVRSKQEYDALQPGSWFIDDDGAVVQKAGR